MATGNNKRKAATSNDQRDSKQPSLIDVWRAGGGKHSSDDTSSKKKGVNPFKEEESDDFEPSTKKYPHPPNNTATHPNKKDNNDKSTAKVTTNNSKSTKSNSNSTTTSTTSTSTTPTFTTSTTSASSTQPTNNKPKQSIPLFLDIDDIVDDKKSLTKAHDKQTNNNQKNSNKFSSHTNTGATPLSSHDRPAYTKSSSESNQSYGKYVKMPYDPKNTYICPHTSEKRPKWELISSVLREQINSASEFQEALLEYNITYRGEWSFIGFHQFINAMGAQERSHFFSHLLPAIVELALALPDLMTDIRIPVLLPGSLNQRVSLTRHQIASLLANAFFCTFPRRNKAPKVKKFYSHLSGQSEDGGIDHMPTINFNGLFAKSGKVIVNKLRCIMNYFRRVTSSSSLDGKIDFDRRQLSDFPAWDSELATLQSLHVYSEGTIEDSDPNFLHVDFSNKYIGGGILGRGCVQEEIMFCIYTELIVARLFNAMLSDTECCIFTGPEKYSTYSGYSDSFVFVDDYQDDTPRDDLGRKLTKVVAMDALNFKFMNDQYDERPILRELNKCYCAFFKPPKTVLRPIATGNWGCGAFNGDLELKAVIQLMAAAMSGRTLHYFTFENSMFAHNLAEMHDFLVNDLITVGELYDALRIFCVERTRRKEEQTIAANSGVFNFLQLYFTNKKM